jgi:hypothetical protein
MRDPAVCDIGEQTSALAASRLQPNYAGHMAMGLGCAKVIDDDCQQWAAIVYRG